MAKEKMSESEEPSIGKLISVDKVPRKGRQTKWYNILSKIPAGKALEITEDEINPETAYGALKRQQKKGRFKSYQFTRRKIKGKIHMYITHPKRTPQR